MSAMRLGLFQNLPLELVETILTLAAYSSTVTAEAMLSVAHWTRAIALKALYSDLVVEMTEPENVDVSPIGQAKLYLSDPDPQHPRTMVASLDAVLRHLHSSVEDAEPDSDGEDASPTPMEMTSVEAPCELPWPSRTPRSAWINMPWEESFHAECHTDIRRLLSALHRLGTIRDLAIDPQFVVSSEYMPRVCDAFKHATHLKFIDNALYKPWGLAMSTLYLVLPHDTQMANITHLEAGAVLLRFQQEAVARLLYLFPSLTHFAFTFYATADTLSAREQFVRDILALADGQIRHVVLVVRERDMDVLDGWLQTVTRTEDNDGTDLLQAAQKLVGTLNSPRVGYYVQPSGPDWCIWLERNREQVDVWTAARRAYESLRT